MKAINKKLGELNSILDIQGQNGNWNYDPYMHGLYNGLEMARSIMTETEPKFRNAPKKWLYKKTILEKLKYWWLLKTNSTKKEGNEKILWSSRNN